MLAAVGALRLPIGRQPASLVPRETARPIHADRFAALPPADCSFVAPAPVICIEMPVDIGDERRESELRDCN
jgi:hypothetical protein